MARVKQVVDWCYARNLTVIINSHWDGGWLERNITDTVDPIINAKMQSYWTQIATTFAGYDSRLLFAGANEPDAETASRVDHLAGLLSDFHQRGARDRRQQQQPLAGDPRAENGHRPHRSIDEHPAVGLRIRPPGGRGSLLFPGPVLHHERGRIVGQYVLLLGPGLPPRHPDGPQRQRKRRSRRGREVSKNGEQVRQPRYPRDPRRVLGHETHRPVRSHRRRTSTCTSPRAPISTNTSSIPPTAKASCPSTGTSPG